MGSREVFRSTSFSVLPASSRKEMGVCEGAGLWLINIFTFSLLVQYRYLTFLDNIMEAAFFGNSLETESEKAIKQLITFIFSSIIRFL